MMMPIDGYDAAEASGVVSMNLDWGRGINWIQVRLLAFHTTYETNKKYIIKQVPTAYKEQLTKKISA